jgi:hypothetical protein
MWGWCCRSRPQCKWREVNLLNVSSTQYLNYIGHVCMRAENVSLRNYFFLNYQDQWIEISKVCHYWASKTINTIRERVRRCECGQTYRWDC